jgi:4-hydroxy-2-oxoheptanedioate aldolase
VVSTMHVNFTMHKRAFFAVFATIMLSVIPCSLAMAQENVRPNRMIEAFKTGRPAIAGLDFQIVEAEHKPFVLTEVIDSIQSVLIKKNEHGQPILPPIVRLPMEGDENAGWAIKAVLERGAMGIIIPHTETSDDALRVIRQIRPWNVRDSKYPFPAGHRSGGGSANWGFENLSRAAGDIWPLNPDGEVLFFPMVESLVGLSNLVEILETPGVSGIIAGPGDLTAALGLAGGESNRPPELTDILENIGQICRERMKYCGMVSGNEADANRWLDAGFKFIWRLDLRDATSGNWYATQYNR